jgi:thiamine kinase-like enzyme
MKQLSTIGNKQIRDLINYWTMIDKRLRDIPADKLVPAHGDAHLGNLIASPKGWLWLDFEDVSLMPRFWDLASAVARTPLLGETKELSDTLIRNYLGDTPNQDDTEAFTLALSARLIASISINIRLAIEGHSNTELAWRRLNNGLRILDKILCD